MTIEWKQPPARAYRKWAPIIEALHANPGEWAFIGRMAYTAGYKYAKQHNLEIRTGNRDGATADVYLRAIEVK